MNNENSKPTPQSLWAVNSDIAWQWHLSFVGQYQQHNYYLHYVIDEILKNNPQIKSIIELGTGYGALTLVLGLWGIKLNIPVVSVDIAPEKYQPIAKVLETLKVEMLVKDQFAQETIDYLKAKIGSEPTLFICDGAVKDWEFNTWTPIVPDNSIIAAHDYMTECHPQGIKEVAERYCEPYRPELWEKLNVQFVIYRKICQL